MQITCDQAMALAAASALAGALVGWLVIRRWIGLLTRRLRVLAEERADERIRLAAEVHDKLLQGIQGLLLTFHVATERMSPGEPSKAMLERALSTADRLIVEGRSRAGTPARPQAFPPSKDPGKTIV
jgi:signal transduction histidine kinase